MSLKQLGLGLLTASLSAFSVADVLIMKNGERLMGSLVSIRDDRVAWRSDSFNTLYIDKKQVDQMVISEPINVNGHDTPCIMDEFDQGMMRLNCDGRESFVHLDMIYALEPWVSEDYRYFSYSGNVRLVGEFFWGNKTDKDWTFDTKAKVNIGDFGHTGEFYYKRDDNTDAASPEDVKISIKYKLDWYYNEHWFINNNTQWSKDDSQNIDSRFELGIGVGYRFFDTDTEHLFLNTGPAYVHETKALDVGSVTETSPGWNYSLDYETQLPTFGLASPPVFYHEHKFTFTNIDGFRTELETSTGVRFPVWNALSADINFDLDYDSDAGENNDSTDYQLNLGMTYTF